VIRDSDASVLDRELAEEKEPGKSDHRASAARYAAGRLGKTTNGSASAVIRGTHLILEEFAHRACTSGLRRSASLAAVGRRIRIGMRSNLLNERIL
jgi:hypothetical protein